MNDSRGAPRWLEPVRSLTLWSIYKFQYCNYVIYAALSPDYNICVVLIVGFNFVLIRNLLMIPFNIYSFYLK